MSRHVCFLIPSLANGGAEKSLVKLANAYSCHGYIISIITFTDNVELKNLLNINIKHYSMGGMSTSNPLLWFRTYKLLKKIRPNIIFGWSLYANLVSSIVKGRYCEKLIISDRVYLPSAINLARKSRWFRSYFSIMAIRYLYPRADVITANSKKNVFFLKNYIGEKANYLYLPNMVNVKSANEFMNQHVSDIPQVDGPHILAVGRLCHQKGFDILIDALAKIKQKHNWSVVIIGSGNAETKLKQQAESLGISKSVYFLGSKNNPYPYYKWADLVVVPSRFEGFPNVPLEAMACGKAVICADCETGPRELTKNGIYGKLVPVDDIKALVSEILALAENSKSRSLLAANAKKYIERTYDEGVVIKKALRLLD